jgi:FeS assembly SUF system protein
MKMNQNKLSTVEQTVIEAQILEALRTCYDPEIPVNIYDLGLIYGIKLEEDGEVEIKMTLTSPHCPAIQSLPGEIESKTRAINGVTNVLIKLVWDPPWDPGRMSDAARLELGLA